MRKLVLTALGTAAACFGIAAATGLGAAPKVLELQPGEIISRRRPRSSCRRSAEAIYWHTVIDGTTIANP